MTASASSSSFIGDWNTLRTATKKPGTMSSRTARIGNAKSYCRFLPAHNEGSRNIRSWSSCQRTPHIVRILHVNSIFVNVHDSESYRVVYTDTELYMWNVVHTLRAHIVLRKRIAMGNIVLLHWNGSLAMFLYFWRLLICWTERSLNVRLLTRIVYLVPKCYPAR